MADPQTTNIGLLVPNTGADVDTWGANALNPDFIALDGLIAGVQTIGVTNAPVTLTAPAAFVATPGPGPTQAQNRVLRFTGAMSGNVRITLPLPGVYLIDNRTTGNFVLSFQGVTATEVIATEQGSIVEIYNDGANVRFVNLGRVGALEHWAGVIAMPAWVNACTVPPFLLADGTIYSSTPYPYLTAKYLAQFGGNGTTTVGVPDLRGRLPLAYDGTGGRITVGGCGLNGQVIGAAIDTQSIILSVAQMPTHFHAAGISDPGHVHGVTGGTVGGTGSVGRPQTVVNDAFIPIGATAIGIASNTTGVRVNSANGIDTTYSTGSGNPHPNVQPSQVTGIWVVKT